MSTWPTRRYRRNLLIALLALSVVLGALHAGRRTPVGPRQGVGISWPRDCEPVAKTQFRVATYNIHRAKGTDGIRDLRRTADMLHDADLVGLNEIAGPTFWGRADQSEQLGRAIKIGWQFAPNQYRWCRYHFGNGLLSRLDVGRWTSEPLIYERVRSNSHRNLLTAEVRAGVPPVTVMVTHIDRGGIRQAQLQQVLEKFAQHTPAVLVGDFNTTGADPLLVAFFADTDNVDAIARTLGNADDKNRIDWIITRGLRVLSGGTEPAGVSDHPYYWVNVEIRGAAAP
jgi:endonuclease/exonuclease/phosphatase family metal-dependent hydrolase